MNRRERRATRAIQHDYVKAFPDKLTPIPSEEFPKLKIVPVKAWRSRKYLVQLFEESNPAYPGLLRLSVCRAKLGTDGRWEDGLTWDELQTIKREVGFWEWQAIEIYPPDHEVVNVANFRHLWLLPVPLSIGFGKSNQ